MLCLRCYRNREALSSTLEIKARIPEGLLKYLYKDGLKSKDIQFQAKNYGEQRQHHLQLHGSEGERQWSVKAKGRRPGQQGGSRNAKAPGARPLGVSHLDRGQ